MTAKEIRNDFGHRLKRFVLKRVQDEQGAEDILQEVFIKIHAHIHELRDEDKLEFWLYRITRNAINDFYRRRQIKTASLDNLESVMEEISASEDVAEIGSCLKPMIDRMSPKYSQALALTELEGVSQQQLAERLNLSFSGAKSRVQRARQGLKEMLLAGCNLEFDHLGTLMDCSPKEDAT